MVCHRRTGNYLTVQCLMMTFAEEWNPSRKLASQIDGSLTYQEPQLGPNPHDERQFVAMTVHTDLPTTEGWEINSSDHDGMFLVILPTSTCLVGFQSGSRG